jgi:hypothetical protein
VSGQPKTFLTQTNEENAMKRFVTTLTLAVTGLVASGPVHAGDGAGSSSSTIVVDNSANGRNNTLDVDPKAGEKVKIKDSGNGKNNTIVVAPDPGGKVVIDESGNGKGNKIIVEEAPGEHVVIHGSGNGKNNNIVIEKAPVIHPLTRTASSTGSGTKSSHQSRR